MKLFAGFELKIQVRPRSGVTIKRLRPSSRRNISRLNNDACGYFAITNRNGFSDTRYLSNDACVNGIISI